MAHHDVFISYLTLDKPISDAVCAALEGHGIRCWVAPRDITPGQDWSDAIIDAFADCRVCLLILSTASNQSDQVKREFQNAVSEAKPILPFRPAVPNPGRRPVQAHALLHRHAALAGRHDAADGAPPAKDGGDGGGLIATLDHKAGEAAPPAAPARAPFPWDADRLARIGADLRQFIGPLGRTLVAEAAPLAHGYDDLCRRLAEHILSERERSTRGRTPRAAKIWARFCVWEVKRWTAVRLAARRGMGLKVCRFCRLLRFDAGAGLGVGSRRVGRRCRQVGQGFLCRLKHEAVPGQLRRLCPLLRDLLHVQPHFGVHILHP